MKHPKEIEDSSFYFYNGYLIRLHNDSAYCNLYQLHKGCGLGSIQDRQKQLEYCMQQVDRLREEQASEEAYQQELDKFTKELQPYIDAIANEVAKKVR